METTQTTNHLTVLEIIPGQPPTVLTAEETRFGNGMRRFTQVVPVPNLTLFQRLLTEVCPGDQIEATIVTEWHDSHSLVYLATYSLLSSSRLTGEVAMRTTP